MGRGFSEFKGKVAVVTGGASGIGRGLAERFIDEGMQVVIADIERDALDRTAAEIGALAIQTDVSDAASVAALADAAHSRFGAVHVVCNNAGIGSFGRIRDLTLADWQWMINVNLWGVIHGVHHFLPLLLENPEGGWIVNTASMGGLAAFPGLGAYATTKFGVTALSETLAQELAQDEVPVGVTVLLPGPVRSNLGRSLRNRPADLAAGTLADADLESLPQYRDRLPWKTPAQAAEVVITAMREGALYAVTHPELVERVFNRTQGIVQAFGYQAEFSPK
ncbi:MAG: SDR family NAD(P)-dependent oxidoreductase [Gammaproteobacteria bacterium]|nr:SDR family NAD(P)-dependent oxidoreductase [Gammaproteobacteria bacterium]